MAHDHPVTGSDAEKLNRARALILEVLDSHDKADHDGEPCPDERTNMVAWIAHAVGFSPFGPVDDEGVLTTDRSKVVALLQRMADYQQYHAEREHQHQPEVTEGAVHASLDRAYHGGYPELATNDPKSVADDICDYDPAFANVVADTLIPHVVSWQEKQRQ